MTLTQTIAAVQQCRHQAEIARAKLVAITTDTTTDDARIHYYEARHLARHLCLQIEALNHKLVGALAHAQTRAELAYTELVRMESDTDKAAATGRYIDALDYEAEVTAELRNALSILYACRAQAC